MTAAERRTFQSRRNKRRTGDQGREMHSEKRKSSRFRREKEKEREKKEEERERERDRVF